MTTYFSVLDWMKRALLPVSPSYPCWRIYLENSS